VCLVASLVLLWATRGIPTPALVPIGPAFYPRILFVVSAVLSAALVVQDLRRPRVARAPAGPTSYRLVVIAFAIFIAYVGLLPFLGYRIATFLFVAALHAALDPPRGRAWLLVLVGALATTAATYLVFERYLSVLLPRGTWTGL
jgi:hypothetical protein